MANQTDVLLNALDYVENHIIGTISVKEIADSCYISISGLQKMFKYVFHLSVKEYIMRRRFSLAARELIETDISILDIALKYGYQNAESFTRGFEKVWGITPSAFRKTRRFTDHTPKLAVPDELSEKEVCFMINQKYDLNDLYNVIQARKNNAYVCADLGHLMWINENLGRDAGDIALLELMRRVEEACDENDIFLRIGGDEFVVFTDSEDMSHAEEIVRKVSAQDGNSVKCGDKDVVVNVHIGAFKSTHEYHVNAHDMFNEISDRIIKIHE